MSSITVYRYLKESSQTSDDPFPRHRRRQRPDGMMPDAQVVESMSFGDSPFRGEEYRKVYIQGHRHIAGASLAAHARNNGLLTKSCRGPARGLLAHDGTIVPFDQSMRCRAPT
ncbi:MAG: hypothetical protein ISN28_09085 [Ectothiorhodospiraceae bacterium AqS1]|nr:hypothetical protein [Ectothiorhodospiraceae bacterium AqS1]